MRLIYMKTCSKCGVPKAEIDFEIRKENGRLRNDCRACRLAHNRSHKTPIRPIPCPPPRTDGLIECRRCSRIKAPSEFYPKRNICKACNRSTAVAALQRRRIKFPYSPRETRTRLLKYLYGISVEDTDRLYQLQKGACAICKVSDKKLCLDHNHATGAVRGLLCNNCNFALGHIKESPDIAQSLIEYIHKHSKSPASVWNLSPFLDPDLVPRLATPAPSYLFEPCSKGFQPARCSASLMPEA